MACPLAPEDVGTTYEKLPAFVKLGRKMLIDESELTKFSHIESNARTYLRNNSLQFPISQAHFIPNKRLMVVMDKLHAYEELYKARVTEFAANYDRLKQDMLTRFPEHRQTLEPFYPPIASVVASFGFSLSIFEVSFPKKVDKTTFATLKAEEAAEQEMKLRFEKEMESQYQKSINSIDDFLKGSVKDLRGKIVETLQHVAEKIRSGKIITKTNLDTMGNVISMFEGLNFLDDKSVQTQLTAVQSLIGSSVDFKTDREAVTALSTAIDNVLAVADSVTDVDSVTGEYFRSITL